MIWARIRFVLVTLALLAAYVVFAAAVFAVFFYRMGRLLGD